MLNVRIYPTLLFRGNGLWKGVKFGDHRYIGDVMNAIRIFNLYRVDEITVLDIGATAEGRCISPRLVEKVSRECMMPLSVGGGIGDAAQARDLLSSGAEKVVLNTHLFADIALIDRIAGASGAQSVVAAVDVRLLDGQYVVFSRNGDTRQPTPALEWVRRLEEAGCGEILINSIDRDGTRQGYDIDLVKAVCAAVKVPVIAMGGASTVEHLREAAAAGASALTAGSMFVFYGRRQAVLINFPEPEELESVQQN